MSAVATKDLASSIAGWAVQAAPALAAAYSTNPADRGPLPDLAVLVTTANVVSTDPWFPMRGHALMRRFAIELLIVVDADPPDTAYDELTDIADALTQSILADRSLGGEVAPPGCSPLVTFNGTPDPAEVELADGTVGRVGRMVLTVGSYLSLPR